MQIGIIGNTKENSEVGVGVRLICKSKALASGFLYLCSSVAKRKKLGGMVMVSLNEQEIVGKVKKMVASQLGKSEDEISLESAFIEDLGADSLDLVELVMAMEDEFGLEISDEDAERIVTVQDVINHILEHKKG